MPGGESSRSEPPGREPPGGEVPGGEVPGGEPRGGPAAGGIAETEPAHGGGGTVLESGAADGFQARWRDVQFGFVDDPRESVRQADELADEVLSAFADALGAHKQALEDRWRGQRDATPDTERLRLVVRAYREFVDRLLTA